MEQQNISYIIFETINNLLNNLLSSIDTNLSSNIPHSKRGERFVHPFAIAAYKI